MDVINNNITNKGVVVQEPTFLSTDNMHYRFAMATDRFGTSNGMSKLAESSIFPILKTDSECAYHYFDRMSTPEEAVGPYETVRASDPLVCEYFVTETERMDEIFARMTSPKATDSYYGVLGAAQSLPTSFMRDMDYAYDRFSGMATLSSLPLGSNNMEKIPGTNVRKLKMK